MIKVIEEPHFLPVSIRELKAHLRLDHLYEEELLEQILKSATNFIEEHLQRSLIARTLLKRNERGQLNSVLQTITLDYPPFISIVGVYRVYGDTPRRPVNRFETIGTIDSPAVVCSAEYPTIEVEYRAGYGETGDKVPPAICHAILSLAGHMYENRSQGDVSLIPTILHFLEPFKIRRLV